MKRWIDADRRLTGFFDSVSATDDVSTIAIFVNPVAVSDPAAFLNRLSARTQDDEPWMFMTTTPEQDRRLVLALPVKRHDPRAISTFLFVDTHSRMVAWWLVAAWRARQLARAAADHADRGEVLAAAACARPFVEASAAFWADAKRLSRLWEEAKGHGHPRHDRDAFTRWHKLAAELYGSVRCQIR